MRKRFHGVKTDPVPHSIYNRLLERIPINLKRLHDLTTEPTAEVGSFGERASFTIEVDFEDQVIEPLLKRWAFAYQKQYRCRFRLGSQDFPGRVDFYVSDGKGPIALFENKRQILNGKDLKLATDQGKSYALMLGLPCFVVASPEGLWIYSLNRNEERLERHISADELKTKDGEIRSLLLSLR